jgi:hypothetical protein
MQLKLSDIIFQPLILTAEFLFSSICYNFASFVRHSELERTPLSISPKQMLCFVRLMCKTVCWRKLCDNSQKLFKQKEHNTTFAMRFFIVRKEYKELNEEEKLSSIFSSFPVPQVSGLSLFSSPPVHPRSIVAFENFIC